jgi:NYN domain
MLFVDGENFTLRGQQCAQSAGIALPEGSFYRRDTFLWMPGASPVVQIPQVHSHLARNARRAYYYTSVCGDDVVIENAREELWALGFTPRVFKKSRKQEKAKGVDISLTKDMLSHAFLDHYDVACLVTGDGDYVPLVEEVKRMGKLVVCVAFPKNGLSRELKLACDEFYDIESFFTNKWGMYLKR